MTRCIFVVLLWAVSGMAEAQVQVRTDQDLEAVWDLSATCDALNICNQPAGTAGVRILIDGSAVATVLVPITFPLEFDVAPLPDVGPHTIRIEAFNCRVGCIDPERRELWPEAAFEVVAADPQPPGIGPAPTLTVQ